jgi:DNA-binding NarL/FixJ family response regulator
MTHGDRRVETLPVTHSVLVVDDYEPWRSYVCGELRKHARWRVIGEAADGLEAVRMAQALKPDLTLLDVGLPSVNGIEAARRMLEHRPSAKILFISEQRCVDIAGAALETGAGGYLFKIDAPRHLLPAMEAVVNRGRFVTTGLSALAAATSRSAHRHQAAFYSEEASLLDDYTRFAEAALTEGSTLIYVGSESRRRALSQRLRGLGFDVDRLIAEERCVLVDDGRFLSDIMVDGAIDDEAFRKAALPLLARAAARSTARIAACGDACGQLLGAGHVAEAVRLERLWDALAGEYPLDLFCGYSIDVPRLGADEYLQFQAVRREHSLVYVR